MGAKMKNIKDFLSALWRNKTVIECVDPEEETATATGYYAKMSFRYLGEKDGNAWIMIRAKPNNEMFNTIEETKAEVQKWLKEIDEYDWAAKKRYSYESLRLPQPDVYFGSVEEKHIKVSK
jgi:hypothetical protein